MNTCETCQARLLNLLYGLLEPEEQKEVLAHIAGCAGCASALKRAEEHQSLLAEAAKREFPDVRFTPPTGTIREAAPLRFQGRHRFRWGRLALAACILIALVAGGAGGLHWNNLRSDLKQSQDDLARAVTKTNSLGTQNQKELTRLRTEIADAGTRLQQLNADWQREAQATERAIADKKIELAITGPRNMQAGAPNEYVVSAKSRTPDASPQAISVQVVNPQSRQVLFAQKVESAQKAVITLPPGLAPRPGIDLAMEVKTQTAEGESVEEKIPLVPSLYRTQVTTDRPMYRPGETVRFRSLTLDRFSLKPAQEDLRLTFRIMAPNGATIFTSSGKNEVVREGVSEPIKGPDGQPVRGVAAAQFELPPESAGGEYTLEVSEEDNRFPPEKRKFLVNAYQVPRLNTELVFSRKSYGPGEEVVARCEASRVEGGAPVAGKPVQARLLIDGQSFEQSLKTDAAGKVVVKFKLPDRLDKGDGSLTVIFEDGGQRESIIRPVPVVVKKLLVDFYPEGGDLVSGVPNRVYFQVHTPLGKPAELRGRLVDQGGNAILNVKTLNDDAEAGVNQGMGQFTFVPAPGKKYQLRIDAPIGIEGQHFLPKAKSSGVVLNIPQGVVEDRIEVVLHNVGKDRQLVVGTYCRGRLLDNSPPLDVSKGETRKLTLRTKAGVSGVYRVTVFEATKGGIESGVTPVAERLIYRRPLERLQIHIDPDKKVYHPGERVEVGLKCTNEKNEPAPSIQVVSVVDQRVLKLADEKTAHSLPAHFYLSSEIRKPEDLEYTDFLVGDHPKASAALDLLLGTQGWRRFAEQNAQELLKKHPNEGRRFLAVSGQEEKRTDILDKNRVLREVERKFTGKISDTERTLATKKAEEGKLTAKNQAEFRALEGRIQTAGFAVNTAQAQLRQFQDSAQRIGLMAFTALLLFGGALCLVIGILRLASSGRHATVFLAAGAGALAIVLVVSLGGTLLFMSGHLREKGAANVEANRLAAPMAAAPVAADKPAMAPQLPPVKAEGAHRGLPTKGLAPPMAPASPQAVAQMRQPVAEPARPMAKLGLMPADARRADGLRKAVQNVEALNARPLGRLEAVPGRAVPGGVGGFGRGAGRRELLRDQDADGKKAALAKALAQPYAVREYAHIHVASADNTRRDFAETLYWQPVLVSADGSARIAFDLPDSTTQFQILCQGHTLDGRLGSASAVIASRLPYSLEPKMPNEISSSDKLTIPVLVANDTPQKKNVSIDIEAHGLKPLNSADSKRQLTLSGNQRKRELFRLEPALTEGEARLTFTGQFDAFSDRVEKSLKIVPDGFPVAGSHSDMLEGEDRHEIVLPEAWVAGTMKCKVQVFPSTLADLQKGLAALLREPCGCFEQSSSSNYPNVLILNYLQESQQNRPEIEARARQLLQSGYQKLTSFECIDPRTAAKRQGYEWFGQTAPPHEALTAYGLLQFRDMARVQPVDEAMIERTRNYLLGRRDGAGGFKRNPRAIDTFGRAPDDITNAYIVWALTESGPEDVDKELGALLKLAGDSKDPYFLALVGNSLVNRGKTKESGEVLKRLASLQKADGHLQGTRTSITGSAGRDLEIETTALAVLAWLKANRPEFHEPVTKAVRWIGTQRGGFGGFGATQSTILALKSLIAYTHANRKTAHAGELRVFVGNEPKPVATEPFPAGCQEPIVTDIPGDALKPGKNKIRVELTGNNAFPYTLAWSYRTLKPAAIAECPVHLTTALDRTTAGEGESVRLKVVLENKGDKGRGMTVAILGLPGGLSIPPDASQLKDMARLRDDGTKPGVISFWEIRGRELILYWREMLPRQTIELNIDLVCRLPGEFRGPASRAYLYYDADRKHWTEPLAVKIQAKSE